MPIFPLLCVTLFLTFVPLGLRAAPGLLTNYTSLVDIGGHHRTWQVGDPTIPGGCHSILELESGMNRWDAASQTWVPAAVGIDLNADGSAFVSENTYCQVLIATNLNVMAAVSAAVSGPDGYNLRLLSTPLAIALYDPVSGSSLTIGVITNSAGAPVEGRPGNSGPGRLRRRRRLRGGALYNREGQRLSGRSLHREARPHHVWFLNQLLGPGD